MFRTIGTLLVVFVTASFAFGQENTTTIASIESAIRSQQYDEALLIAKSALQKTPDNFRIWTLSGIALSIKGDNSAALAAFQKALALSPAYPAALKGEARLLHQLGDRRVILVLKTILRADPNDQIANEMLALNQEKEGDCNAAVEHFRLSKHAIQSHPDSIERYGYCLMRLKRFEEAISVLDQLVALLPQNPYARYDLALIQIMANHKREAIQSLEPLLAENTSDPDTLSLASEAYEAVGDTPRAVSYLRQAIVQNPMNADYYTRFAALCFDHDSFQVGIDVLDAGLRRISNDSVLYVDRGLLYVQLAQYDKAEADFKAAERLDLAQNQGSYALGLLELQNNHLDEALVTVKSRLRVHPRDPSLHYLLAKILMEQGAAVGSAEFTEAMDSVLLAVKLKPDLTTARDLLASMYMKSDQNGLAIEQCRLALRTDPSDQGALYRLIMALRNSGQKEEIQTLVRRFSALQQASRKQELDQKRYKLIEPETVTRKQ